MISKFKFAPSSFLRLAVFVTFIFTSLFPPVQYASASNPTTGNNQDAPPVPPTANPSCTDFSELVPGTNIEGLGTVLPDLNISTTGYAVALGEGILPRAYNAPNENSQRIINGGIDQFLGGFSDINKTHEYTFSFAPGISVDYFTIQMLDYGDYNPTLATEHQATLIAYDANNNQVATDELNFTSDGTILPRSGSAGDLWFTGDAISATPGQPGNYAFTVAGSGITRVELQFSSNLGEGATDPNFALSVLCFSPEEEPPIPPNTVCANFIDAVPSGTNVEGLDTIIPDLNINSTGYAVAIAEGELPRAYNAPNENDARIINGGVDQILGGFSDINKVHEYSFSFAPDVSVNYFSLQMLDYGDYNPLEATWNQVYLAGYNANGMIVDSDILTFTSDGRILPRSGSAGDLWFTGDAITSRPGQPGNFNFIVAGDGIVRLELRFTSNLGEGATDPNFALSVLCFAPEEQPTPPPNNVCANFIDGITPGTNVEGLGAIVPELNISTEGGYAVSLAEGELPRAYNAPNENVNRIINGGVDQILGGFSDVNKNHVYNFSFAPDVSVDYFAIQMLDYGDYNPSLAIRHETILSAYDDAGNLVDSDTLVFTSDGTILPRNGSAGDLWFTADGLSSAPGQPGNYTFAVSGSNITRVELRFVSNLGEGATDPNFALSVLCFEPETPPPTDIPQTCEDLGYTTIAEDSWNEHVIDGMNPITLGYARPSAADYAIVNTGWEWTGLPDQEQVTEIHSVVTPFGTVTSQDYGNDELAGQVLWFGAPQGAFDQPSLQVTIDYAGDGSDPGSHRSHGLIAWCDNPDTEPPAPQEPLTCENIGLEPVASADWSQHVIRDMTPVTDNFAQPDDANYVIVNTAWAWSGLPDQHQVTEKHSVDTPLGTAVSDDYGDEELAGELIWYDVLQGAFGAGNLPVTIDYAGNGSDPGSHFSKGLVNWCLDPNAPAASSTLLQPLGDNGAQVEVAYTCSDAAPTLVSATMNGYTVEDGQTLWLVPNDDSFSNTVDGGLTAIYGPAFSLAVTCAAADGAQSTTIVVPDLGD